MTPIVFFLETRIWVGKLRDLGIRDFWFQFCFENWMAAVESANLFAVEFFDIGFRVKGLGFRA